MYLIKLEGLYLITQFKFILFENKSEILTNSLFATYVVSLKFLYNKVILFFLTVYNLKFDFKLIIFDNFVRLVFFILDTLI